MVLPAASANTFTSSAIAKDISDDVQEAVRSAEGFIQRAISLGRYTTLYDAKAIGNPSQGVNDDAKLTTKQIQFRDAMKAAGYQVDSHERGYWKLSWGDAGLQSDIVVYLAYTSVNPGAILTNTYDVIKNALNGLVPPAYSEVSLVPDFNETDIGLVDQSVNVFIIRAQQQDVSTDNASTILSAMVGAGLGYSSTNTKVVKTT